MAGERSGSDSATDSDSAPACGVWLAWWGVAGTADAGGASHTRSSHGFAHCVATYGGRVARSGGVGYCLGKCC
eukprot:355903-Chlamydomonas_euryale.AAC.6